MIITTGRAARHRRASRWLLAAWSALACCLAAVPAVAQEVSWPGNSVPARYWVDESGSASFDTASAMLADGKGLPADSNQVMPLGANRAAWYLLDLPAVEKPVQAILTVPHAGMDAVDMYLRDDPGGVAVMRAGDSLPVSQWSIRYLHPAFGLTLVPGGNTEAYLRVQHSQPVGVRWQLWDIRSFNESNKLSHLSLGAYVGLTLLVVLLSCANAFSWRDPIHFYYAVNVVLVGLTQLSLTGLAGEYFWPDNAWWNDIAPVVLPSLAMAGSGWLVREVVAERGMRVLPASLLLYTLAGVGIAAGFLTMGRAPFFLLLNSYIVLGMLLILSTLVWFTWRRPRVGAWILAGFAILLLAAVFPVLRNLGILPTSFATQYAPIIASAIDLPLMLTGLYFRSRERRDNRMRLAALSHTDPLTGVGSHRVLMDRLRAMIQSQGGESPRGAVVRVRLKNGADIQNTHGMEAGQAALVRAAECVALEASEGDVIARHKNGDFVLLLTGSVTREHLAATARNIIARGLKFSGRLPPTVILQLQVAGARPPYTAADPQELLHLLESALEDDDARPFRALRTAEEADLAASLGY